MKDARWSLTKEPTRKAGVLTRPNCGLPGSGVVGPAEVLRMINWL